MGSVVVKLNQQPVTGAEVSVSEPPLVIGVPLGGIAETLYTDENGRIDIGDPNVFNAPVGSQADVVARYYDDQGNEFIGRGTVTSQFAFTGTTEAWSPDPLIISLTPYQSLRDTAASAVVTHTETTSTQPQGTPINSFLNAILVILAAGIGGYLFLTLILPELRKSRPD